MQSKATLAELHSNGYVLLQSHCDAKELEALQREAEHLIERHYNKENLFNHSVYPSDSTDTRVSHAMMIAEGESIFPAVDHSDAPVISSLLQAHNAILSKLTGQPVATSSRCMLNYQNYFAGSKPVGEHFDGEYIRTQRAEDGIEFKLIEGILPRFVGVLVIANDNDGKGTELVDNGSGEVYKPVMNAGDLLLFDNIRLRHRVPRMEKPRITLGLRNFDHMALHFAADERAFLADDYERIPEGWVSESVDCNKRFASFMAQEWPEMQKDYSHYF